MTLRKFKKILLWFFLSVLFLLIAAWIFIQTPFGQNWIVSKVTTRLSKDLNTRIEIKHVNFSFFNKMDLEGLMVEDHNQDTLLYAGDAQVRITDWFFFKKNVELKYIGLENAVIHMNRKDSIWNYQFLVDYFSPSKPGSPKKQGGTNLNIKILDLKNVAFIKKDEWLGQNMTIAFGSLALDANNISISDKQVDLNFLTITDPFVHIYNYPKLKSADTNSSTITVSNNEAVDSLLKWNAAGWIVKAKTVDIKNGTFKNDKYPDIAPTAGYFDGRHILFNNINTTFTNLNWNKDTIIAQMVLQAKERSGLEVKDFEANVRLTPQDMTFANLTIQTNNSVIRDYYKMSFADFSDMDDYIHKVKMQANFNNSEIDSDDIAFFAPALKTWKKNITLKGSARGTVDDIVGNELVIEAGKNTLLNGDISLTGLPDINQTFIDFKANDFRTTYHDALAFVPAIRNVTQPNLRELEYLRFSGSFTGFIRDFVTFGTLQTSLGVVKSDLNMKLPLGKDPLYSGTLSTDYFRLGEFIGDSKIGIVSLNGSLKGKGFKEGSRKADLDGKINFIDYNGYRYNNIALNGVLDKKKFNGIVSIDDPEAQLTLNGLIDFNAKTPIFNFLADVQKAHLKALKLSQTDIAFKGKFNLNFTGDNIDNFLGYAAISDATITRNGNPLPFDSLIVSSEYANNIKTLRARSNEFEATLSGDFNIRDLPDAFKLFLNRYYPAYIKPANRFPENESLSFDITTQYVDDYIGLIDSSLSGFNNSHIYGNLNTSKNELVLNADVPQFKYKQYNFDAVNVVARGTRDSLSLTGSASNINISDSLNIPLAQFHVNARNDSSKVNIRTGANQGIYQAALNAEVLTYNNGVKIEFDPSSFVVNGKTWSIDDNGELEFRKRVPVTGSLVMRESNQEVRVRSVPSETGDWNDLAVELKKVNLGDFAPFFMPKNRLEGMVSGNVLIEDPTNNLFITSDNIVGEGIRLDNDSLGDVNVKVNYDGHAKQLKVNGASVNTENGITFDANIFTTPEKQKDNIIALKAKNFQLSILERFLGNLFSDIRGYVTGNFDITGEFNNLQVTGKGMLKDAGLLVNFTKCFYNINDTEIELKSNEINLDGIVLTDPVTDNPVYLSGSIQHSHFKDMFFDLSVSTRKPKTTNAANNRPILLLNTGYNDNKQFYGKVKGTGSFSLSGDESDLYMKIDAIASDRDSSQVTIPSYKGRESGIADFLVERKYGREMVGSAIGSGTANITYDVDITANPMATVRIVLDELTGDEIKGKGSGTLNIRSGTNEKLSMHGQLAIEEGDYLFTFQSFFKKPFKLKEGSESFITWSGDPYAAKIRFEAMYTAENVSFSPLVNSSLSVDPSYSKIRDNVLVVVLLTGDLFKPDFKFKLEFPANSKVNSDFAIMSQIEQIENNPNEINRQVTYLIVFNSFAPQEAQASQASIANTNPWNELAYSTISSLSGLFFNEINRKLNSELSRILKSDNVSVNFTGSVYNRNLLDQQSNNFNINQSRFGVNVPISMFKDRFILTLGSTLDVPLQTTIQQNVQFLPDVTAEWLINESGSIRASFFYRQNLDYLTTSSTGAARTKRTGANIAYRKEFDTLNELFSGKKKRNKKPEIPPAQEQPPVAEEEKEKKSGTN